MTHHLHCPPCEVSIPYDLPSEAVNRACPKCGRGRIDLSDGIHPKHAQALEQVAAAELVSEPASEEADDESSSDESRRKRRSK